MSEAERIVALSRRARARGEQLCLATVVLVEGSAYRKAGARMLVTSGGERSGTISGGCLESEVSRKAWWLTAQGPRVERYSSFADEDGGMPYGLGCGGTVSLLLEQGEPAEAVLSAIERVLSTREPAVVISSLGPGSSLEDAAPTGVEAPPRQEAGTIAVLRLIQAHGDGYGAEPAWVAPGLLELDYLRPVSTDGDAREPGGGGLHASLEAAARIAFDQRGSCYLAGASRACDDMLPEGVQAEAPAYFVEYLAAPPALTIFGAGDDAQPLAELAHALGWRVSVADGRAHLARRERFLHAAEVRVLDYADPALRAACGMARYGAPGSPLDPADVPRQRARPTRAEMPVTAEAGQTLLADDIVVILTHSYEQDRALLTALLPRPLRYLGLLGPRHRTQRLLEEVAPLLGLSVTEGFERLHSPIGIDLGTGDPAAVALSIVAEIQAVLHERRVTVTRAGAEESGTPANGGLEAAIAEDQLA